MSEIANYLRIEAWPPHPDTTFWLALVLVAGALLGELAARRLDLSRIVGYGGAGVLAALLGRDATTFYATGTLRVVIDLALGVLLFELGSRVNLRWLRNNPALCLTSVAEAALSLGAMFALLTWLGMARNMALVGATILMASSCAVVGRMTSELRTSGQVTERMVVMTAMNTLLAVLAHKLLIGWLHLDEQGNWVQGLSLPLYAFAGSVLVAALLYRVVAWIARHLNLNDENAALLILGLLVLAINVARMLNLSTLLVPLLAGVLLRNTSPRPWTWPRHFGSAGGVLVLMLFVIVGACWTPAAVLAGGATALLLLAVRVLARGVAIFGLAHWSGITWRQSLGLTLALLPVSGTSLVLLAELQANHPGIAAGIAPIVFSATFIMAIAGPLLVHWGLRRAGETRAGGEAT